MCLGIPGKVVAIDGLVAVVDFWGVRREVRLDIVDEEVGAGDHVLTHVGYAIRRIPDQEIEATLAVFEELLEAEDVLEEIGSGRPETAGSGLGASGPSRSKPACSPSEGGEA